MKYVNMLIIVVCVATLAACSSSDPKVTEKEVTRVVKETVVEERVVTATPEPDLVPTVGGRILWAVSDDVDTLDAHKSGLAYQVLQYLGGSLVAKDPETGQLIPYLAQSWEISDDALTYEFKLREDVTFHDGSPLTAHDYAWSFNRAIDPATGSPIAGPTLQGLANAEAVDDYTLRLNMSRPNPVLMNTLSGSGYLQPLSQAYVESLGDDYGRNPIGVGPFKFKEWVTGDKIVLERNPDFDWGPAYTRGAAPFIESIEYRIIPEYATQIAGLEAGEIDYMMLMPKDIESIQDSGRYHVFSSLQSGTGVVIAMNTSKPPFDDVRVRQALNYASDREAIVRVVALGYATPSYGPITPGTVGYWPGVEYLGYSHDIEMARALMEEAGYTLGEDGILEKDGEKLSLPVKTLPEFVKTAEILQAQYQVLGVQLQIESMDLGALYADIMSGNYDLTLILHGWPDHMILFGLLHPSTLGGFNYVRVNDPQLTEMLDSLFAPSTPEKLQQIANDVQKYVVEQAFFVPLYAPTDYYALSNHVYDAVYNSFDGSLLFYDAYTELTVP